MHVLAITRLFPNAAAPLTAPYNRLQLGALSEFCDVSVMATLPWFPGARLAARWSAAGRFDGVPYREQVDGMPVVHPRALYVPKVSGWVSPALYAASLGPELFKRRKDISVVLGAWAYPDGCAAVGVAQLLGVPAVVKVHGSDLNVLAYEPGPGKVLRRMLPRADRVMVVSRALGQVARDLGVADERVAVVYNGVDSSRFFPADRAEARAELGLSADGKLFVYVGNVLETKGIYDLLEAFRGVSGARLVIVGGGPAKERCDEAGDQVIAVGPRPHEEVPRWIAASDVLVLPSWAEGTPNVVLEALSCGRRVVATDVGGIPDLIDRELLGELVPAKSPETLRGALQRAVERDYDPLEIARVGGRGDWADSGRALHSLLEEVVAEHGARR